MPSYHFRSIMIFRSFYLLFLIGAGVNLLVGTENGLMLLDRSGQGKVYNLINRRRFQQMEVLEGLNVLVTISGELNINSPFDWTKICFVYFVRFFRSLYFLYAMRGS